MSDSVADELLAALAACVTTLRETASARTTESEQELVALLYHDCHGRQELLRGSAPARLADERSDRAFIERLSTANSGNGPEHNGWILTAIEDDNRYAVELDGLTLWIDQPAPVGLGERVAVQFPKEYRELYPGHYVVIGDADDGSLDNSLRLYWNVSADGSEALVRHASRIFNRARIPFRLKVLSSPVAYSRADAAILYLPRAHRAAGANATQQLYREIRETMRAPVSLFVLPLAPGLGLAEDPNDGSSFGMHRSQLLAPLLYDAVAAPDPLPTLAASLETKGYRADRFYLNPGSTASYPEFRIDVD